LTVPGEVVQRHGVSIIGYTDLPSRMATQSSQLYGTNLRHLLTDLTPEKDGQINVNMEDEAIRGATVIKDGEVTWPPPAPKLSAAPPPSAEAGASAPSPEPAKPKVSKEVKRGIGLAVAVFAFAWLGANAPATFLNHFTVFVLACFIGWQVIWNVSHALHTPLMSVTNAISGIIVIGALLQISAPSGLVVFLSAIAILIASINIAGGFLVTQRMLRMFRRDE
jgi:NAD(P) transhydrogenase subunit alpha